MWYAAGSPIRRPFPPEQLDALRAEIRRDITRRKHLLRARRHRSYPRVVKRSRHNSYRVKRPDDVGIRYAEPPAIALTGQPAVPCRTASADRPASHTDGDGRTSSDDGDVITGDASERQSADRQRHRLPADQHNRTTTHPTPRRPDTAKTAKRQRNTHRAAKTDTNRSLSQTSADSRKQLTEPQATALINLR